MVTGTEKYYRARAQEYDQVYEKPERQADLARLRAWLAPVLDGRRVLEVAAGTGYWTAVYAGRAGACDAGVTGAYDAVFAGFFWSHIPVGLLDGFLAGLAGQLDHPATLVFIDNRYVPGSNCPLSDSDVDGNTYQRRQLSDGSTWDVIKNFPSPGEIQARLGRLGQVTVTELRYYWTAVCTLGHQQ